MKTEVETKSSTIPKMEVISSGDFLKVLQVTGEAGMSMPLHYCTHEACVVVEKGKSVLHFENQNLPLQTGDSYVIPSGLPHNLEMLEEFKAKVIMARESEIKFCS